MTSEASRVFRPRIIPVLLLKDGLLYKSARFRNPKYVGDPRVAVKIFNDKGADELAVLDIMATRERRGPNMRLVEEIAGECFMPLAYGGGITTREQIRTLLSLGVEKVVLNTRAVSDPDFVAVASADNGAQSITVCIDVRRDMFGRRRVMTEGGQAKAKTDLLTLVRQLEQAGAGEIVIQSIDRDGTLSGYDLELITTVSEAVTIPVIALGGAASEVDFAAAIAAGASAAAAGAMFVFQGPHRAVLITYPNDATLSRTFASASNTTNA